MGSFLVKQVSSLTGTVCLSGDKSIAHRSIIISAIALGKTTVENSPSHKDFLSTINAFKKLGIRITRHAVRVVTVFGKGLYGLKKPTSHIFVGDSGTSLRLILGVLAGQHFRVTLTAGKSLSQRPMLRVTKPLRMMGAEIKSRQCRAVNGQQEEYPPITIKGGDLKSITYRMPVASAQVKSAILLAGLFAKGKTKVIEPIKTRDHTERMLKLFGARLKPKQNTILIKGNKELVSPGKIYIPGDISSASFFIVLASILPNSKIRIKNVSLNPSRLGIIRVLKRMGADIRLSSVGSGVLRFEPMGDIIVKSSKLKGILVSERQIPSLIDELPILMVAACNARGKTVFAGVEELRLKETDRIKSMSENLIKMGAKITVLKTDDSEKIVIQGAKQLQGTKVKSFGDHRTAMSMIVAGLLAGGRTFIDDISCINKSFPDFISKLKALIR